MMLHEKYRPRQWADLVGQDRAVKTARRLIERPGFQCGAFWIECAGDNCSGTGKSSLAWLIGRALADDFFIQSISGSDLNRSALREIERAAYLTTWAESKPFRVLIVDEAHAIPSSCVDALLKFLEGLPKHFVVIFTTTRKVDQGLFGDDCGPFASRCYQIRLTNQGLAEAFAKRARWIADQEELNGKPMSAYVRLVQTCKNNLRAVLQRIEAGEML